MLKHTQIIRQEQWSNCLSVFDHYLGLALKGFTLIVSPSETHSGKFIQKHLSQFVYLGIFCFYVFFIPSIYKKGNQTTFQDFLMFLEWNIPQIKYYLYCTNQSFSTQNLRKLGNIRKLSTLVGRSSVPSLCSRYETLAISTDFSGPVQFCLIFLL